MSRGNFYVYFVIFKIYDYVYEILICMILSLGLLLEKILI